MLLIEEIKNEHLKKDLHLKKCVTLDEVTKEVVYLVDNCEIYEEVSKDIEAATMVSDTQIEKLVAQQQVSTDQIADDIVKRLSETLRVQNSQYYQTNCWRIRRERTSANSENSTNQNAN